MKTLRVAVIGAGYLGKFHAEKYAGMPHVDLVGVADLDPAAADEVAARFGAKSYSDHRKLLGKVDAASVVTSTPAHFEVSRDFLANGAHLLIEKPITENLDQARELMDIAEKNGRIIQTGHIERFNPVTRALRRIADGPFLFEARRMSRFKERAADVSVILDMMIHDIDIALALANSPVRDIRASGAPVATDRIDMAMARIEFENGCAAHLAAGRVAESDSRTMTVFQKDAYIQADFGNREMTVFKSGAPPEGVDAGRPPGDWDLPGMEGRTLSFEKADALKDELESFIEAIRTKKSPEVTGRMGAEALEIALIITDRIHESLPAAGKRTLK
ncbi:UDP-N-acetyl-D-glucosamine dehydrogenase [Candidatus Desulfarcum epimagneticum]|uniref:UDP-N-acetyl-D-glucosamine dehydrogenase n=1 Tax=uncultured Desulfobacteraceae bacterium TaxID=218296 RepID=A0A484HJX4_9BACT|nr:UDP-N-acetyl-D-glucosamine dehydrogenase [uncultured Desulfobacteraceae bacterium]